MKAIARVGAAPAAAQSPGPVVPQEVQALDLAPAKARVNLEAVLNHPARTVQTAKVRRVKLR